MNQNNNQDSSKIITLDKSKGICPIMSTMGQDAMGRPVLVNTACVGDGCAWYCPEHKCCSVKFLYNIVSIADVSGVN